MVLAGLLVGVEKGGGKADLAWVWLSVSTCCWSRSRVKNVGGDVLLDVKGAIASSEFNTLYHVSTFMEIGIGRADGSTLVFMV